MMYQNREAAAELLVKKLMKYKDTKALVLGIPRGAMPMAKLIAERLNADMSAVLVHKIPAPMQEELAIGSVGLSGKIFRLPDSSVFEVPNSYYEKAAAQQLEVLKSRKKKFNLGDLNCKDRTVIIVDDGIATGATALGAIHEVRAQGPRKLVLAAAVVAHSTASSIKQLVDEFIVLQEPEYFYAVSQFFVDFSQVTDEEVVEIMNAFKASKEKSRQNEASL